MKKSILIGFISTIIVFTGCKHNDTGLDSCFTDDFTIGAALNLGHIFETDSLGVEVIKENFNSIVAENCTKPMYLQPKEGEFYWKEADAFVDFGVKNGMEVIGHCLMWHWQLPNWFFVDDQGNDVSAETLKARMKAHITAVVTRYKGRVNGWDVVNEAILDDGSMRDSKFYKILGKEFIHYAFQCAHEADPNVELYYNDYNMFMKPKRDAVIALVNDMKSKGIRVDGIGMQSHLSMTESTIEDVEKGIVELAATGAKVMITEFDMTALPSPWEMSAEVSNTKDYKNELNPYVDGLPEDVLAQWNKTVRAYLDLFKKHSDVISRVTMWGVSDRDSWKNNFPVKGRTDYALLFDRNYTPKQVVTDLINE